MQSNQDKKFNGVKFASRTVGQRPPAQQTSMPSNLSRQWKVKTKKLPGLKVFGVLVVFLALVLESRPILSFGSSLNQNLADTKSNAGVNFNSTTNSSLPSESPEVLADQAVATSTTPSSPPVKILTPAPQQAPSLKSIGRLIVNATPTGFLNVRIGPSTSSKVVTKVYPGQVLSYAQSQGGWCKVILNNGQSGWVDGQYVTVSYSPAASAHRGDDYDPNGEDGN